MAKKLTGKTVNWIVVDNDGFPTQDQGKLTRKAARLYKNFLNETAKYFAPHRIARIEVSK